MPDDLNKQTEEQLRRYAENRRLQAGQPWQLPSVTRNLLQSEVQRRWGKLRPRAKSVGLPGGWLPWALAFGLFLVAGGIWWLDPGAPAKQTALLSPALRPATADLADTSETRQLAQNTDEYLRESLKTLQSESELAGREKAAVNPALPKPDSVTLPLKRERLLSDKLEKEATASNATVTDLAYAPPPTPSEPASTAPRSPSLSAPASSTPPPGATPAGVSSPTSRTANSDYLANNMADSPGALGASNKVETSKRQGLAGEPRPSQAVVADGSDLAIRDTPRLMLSKKSPSTAADSESLSRGKTPGAGPIDAAKSVGKDGALANNPRPAATAPTPSRSVTMYRQQVITLGSASSSSFADAPPNALDTSSNQVKAVDQLAANNFQRRYALSREIQTPLPALDSFDTKSNTASPIGNRQLATVNSQESFEFKSQAAINPVTKPSTQPFQVLETFDLARQGNQVTITDSDGSVYQGTVASLTANLDFGARTAGLGANGRFGELGSVTATTPSGNQPDSPPPVTLLGADVARKDVAQYAPTGSTRFGNQVLNTGFKPVELAAPAPRAVVPFHVAGTNVTLQLAVAFDGIIAEESMNANGVVTRGFAAASATSASGGGGFGARGLAGVEPAGNVQDRKFTDQSRLGGDTNSIALRSSLGRATVGGASGPVPIGRAEVPLRPDVVPSQTAKPGQGPTQSIASSSASTVIGRLTVGATNQIEIHALSSPAPPK